MILKGALYLTLLTVVVQSYVPYKMDEVPYVRGVENILDQSQFNEATSSDYYETTQEDAHSEQTGLLENEDEVSEDIDEISYSNMQHVIVSEDPETVLDEFANLIPVSIEKALSTLDNLKASLLINLRAAIAEGKGSLKSEVDLLHREIERYGNMSSEIKADVSDCVQGREDQVDKLSEKHMERIKECRVINDRNGSQVIKMAKRKIASYEGSIKKYTNQWNKCETRKKPNRCRSKAALRIGAALVLVPATINNIALDAIPKIQALFPEVKKCSIKIDNELVSDGDEILKAIEKCVLGKIKPPSTTPGST